ncbi:DEAD/DEAH box helicase [Roseovarius tibetensis]|uniref:DEAD/DEAH box helicase n=1 Tax=Roseovarius tibetensis TaxID=2685897 RepID=UPI003D7FFA27
MIPPSLSSALAARGYDTLTPVQEAVTDPALGQSDLLVSAQTGSGKTVGFGLAIAPTLMDGGDTLPPASAPLALIVAPTRELALQVMRELSWLYAGANARVVTCVGGMDARDERRALERGAHIVVGTPGRLCDHINRGALDMTGLRAVVLDEADEMLDLGFREDLEFMLAAAPEGRRTMMFSATVPPMIAKLAEKFQRDAQRVTTLTGATQHADIAYQALRVAPQDAEGAVINLLRYHDAQNAIVFANTRAMVARLTARLANRGFAVVSLSGELSQSERTHALQAMRDGRAKVCVATDVAARGIDLPNLDLVVHAELPSNADGLLHRSGRTGRAGRKGISALIVPVKAVKKAERLLKTARITAEWTTPPSASDIEAQDHARLLADPVWSEAPTEAEAAFATELLAQHAPAQIAAAYLRLYRARVSAPEDLSAPDAAPPARERTPFGPSTWFALSVGANDRAEARWLLPLLCRAGNLDKSSIGAIRVQPDETFVELSEPAAAGFLKALGADGALDEGITARKLDGAPDATQAPRPPRDAAPRPAPKPRAKPQGKPDRPRPDRMAQAVESGAVTPAKPARDADPKKPAQPARKEKPVGKPAAKTGGKPFDKAKGKPAPKGADATPSAKTRHSAPASDTSKRFTPPGAARTPGKGKPGTGKPGAGKSASNAKGAPSRSGAGDPAKRRKP